MAGRAAAEGIKKQKLTETFKKKALVELFKELALFLKSDWEL